MRQWDGISAVGGLTPEDIRAICDRIHEAVSPKAIILFGSRARGTQGDGSDIDILLEKEYGPSAARFRVTARAYAALTDLTLDRGMEFDVLTTAPAEASPPLAERGEVYRDIERDGVVLYAA